MRWLRPQRIECRGMISPFFSPSLKQRVSSCSQFMSFDDRRFVRRARRLKLAPEVILPK
jgi:hypothetical protein